MMESILLSIKKLLGIMPEYTNFDDDIIKETIDKIDVLNTTPMEALNILFDLKQKIKKGE